MIKAIVYTSKTGTTEWYAKTLGEELNLPVFTFKEGKISLSKSDEIIYLGCIRADNISLLSEARSIFTTSIVIGVGLTATGGRMEEVRKANNIDVSIPLFTLQGGFIPSRLHGIEKLILSLVVKSQRKNLKKKTNRTKDEEDMLSLLTNGGTRTTKDNLKAVIEECKRMEEKR
ncbi:MAG: flavodoxin domain-containing protein [Spirochaetales bacterium]|nr:flavodoxin domain-containing protein [Spirochaetales bacterium]